GAGVRGARGRRAGVRLGRGEGRIVTNVLGMDGGGRKTYAVLSDENGAMLGAGESGAPTGEIAGIEGAAGALVTAASDALEAAGISPDGVAAVVLGLAGMDWPSDEGRLTELASPIVPGAPRKIVNDAFIALRAGASESWGSAGVWGPEAVSA